MQVLLIILLHKKRLCRLRHLSERNLQNELAERKVLMQPPAMPCALLVEAQEHKARIVFGL
jgi:hypothetical protein